MLKDINIPISTTTRDINPEKSAEEKLSEIASKKAIRPSHFRELGLVYFKLPYVDPLSVEFVEDKVDGAKIMSINHFNIGDEALMGHGIGTRLLKRAVRYGLECHPDLRKLRHASANLALVNTVAKVVGEEYVTVTNQGERYGFGSDKDLEEIFDAKPYDNRYPYLVDRVEAILDRDVLEGKLD